MITNYKHMGLMAVSMSFVAKLLMISPNMNTNEGSPSPVTIDMKYPAAISNLSSLSA
jgi:hypothetical protein